MFSDARGVLLRRDEFFRLSFQFLFVRRRRGLKKKTVIGGPRVLFQFSSARVARYVGFDFLLLRFFPRAVDFRNGRRRFPLARIFYPFLNLAFYSNDFRR